MILELIACAALSAGDAAPPAAPPAPVAELEPDTSIERYRTPFETLNERAVGSASRAVRYNWRNQTLSFGAFGGGLAELNNFQSERVGGFIRTSTAGLMLELAASAALTQGTDSTYALSLTPYRQSGRPSRIEIDLNLGLPLFEGVATPHWSWMPTVELVLFFELDLRYRAYVGGVAHLGAGDALLALFAPRMGDPEVVNLEGQRLPGMRIDRGKYDLLAGLVFELQLQSGFFIAPRIMLCPGLLNPVTGSNLQWWWDFSAAVGWGF